MYTTYFAPGVSPGISKLPSGPVRPWVRSPEILEMASKGALTLRAITLMPLTALTSSLATMRPTSVPVSADTRAPGTSHDNADLSSATLTVAMPGLLYVGLSGNGSMNGYMVSTCSVFGYVVIFEAHWSGPAFSAPAGTPNSSIGWLRK
jgi:hypothetical protein